MLQLNIVLYMCINDRPEKILKEKNMLKKFLNEAEMKVDI